MRKSHVKLAQLGEDDRLVVREKVNAFLRQRHPLKTAENIAADTGISVNTVEKWLSARSAPTSWAFLRLLGAYGPDFICAVMDDPPSWLSKAAREEERRRVERQIAELQDRLSGGAR